MKKYLCISLVLALVTIPVAIALAEGQTYTFTAVIPTRLAGEPDLGINPAGSSSSSSPVAQGNIQIKVINDEVQVQVQVNQQSITVRRGGTATVTLSVVQTKGFTRWLCVQAVSPDQRLEIKSVQPSSPWMGNQSKTVKVTIYIHPDLPLGTYNLQVLFYASKDPVDAMPSPPSAPPTISYGNPTPPSDDWQLMGVINLGNTNLLTPSSTSKLWIAVAIGVGIIAIVCVFLVLRR